MSLKYNNSHINTYSIYLSKILLLGLFMFLVALTLPSQLVLGATISGSVYDIVLDKESNVIIEIDTVPKQFIVSKDGDYFLNVNPGSYTIHAYTSTSDAYEQINVTDDGNYTIDIVLLDSIDNSDLFPYDTSNYDLTPDSDINVTSDIPDGSTSKLPLLYLVAGVTIVLLFSLLGLYLSKNKDSKNSNVNSKSEHKEIKESSKTIDKELLDEYESKILSLVKKEKRTTQKEIRKEIPLSESKISLVITDLENKGKIRKIKKGRGNVLIFVKD